MTRSIATYAKLVRDASKSRQTRETPVSTALLVHSYFLTGFPERLPMYREPPARRQKRFTVRLSMSLFKIHVTNPGLKKRRTDRHFCAIGTTNAVLDYSLCGGDILGKRGFGSRRVYLRQGCTSGTEWCLRGLLSRIGRTVKGSCTRAAHPA